MFCLAACFCLMVAIDLPLNAAANMQNGQVNSLNPVTGAGTRAVVAASHPFRNVAGALLTNLAVAVAGLSLLAFFGSLALLHGESSLAPQDLLKIEQTVATQLGKADPTLANTPQTQDA